MMTELPKKGQLLDNRFYIQKELEAGGMSHLFLARDTRIEQKVVVKVCNDEKKAKSFQGEVKLLNKLHHPGIQKLVEHGTYLEMPYYAMPFISSTNFRQYLDDKYTLREEDILHYFTQITSAVGYLHAHHIIHCDLKPQNMLVADDDTLILGDFGLSHRASRNRKISVHQETIWGSPVYLAPELPQGTPASYASDVYALGITLFILYLGYPPFFDEDLDELIKMHQTLPPPCPHQLSSVVSTKIEAIILQALAKDRHQRFNNAGELDRVVQNYWKADHQHIQERIIPRHPEMLAYNQETRSIQG